MQIQTKKYNPYTSYFHIPAETYQRKPRTKPFASKEGWPKITEMTRWNFTGRSHDGYKNTYPTREFNRSDIGFYQRPDKIEKQVAFKTKPGFEKELFHLKKKQHVGYRPNSGYYVRYNLSSYGQFTDSEF